MWTQTAQSLDWSRPASWPRRHHGTGRFMTVLYYIVYSTCNCLKRHIKWHCLSPLHHTFRENRYLLFLTENYAALDIRRHYLHDVVASIAPGSDGSSERLLEKMEPFILFGSSFPRDKEFTQVGAWEHLHDALLWRCNGGKSYSSLYGQQSWVLIRVSLSEPHIDEFAVNFLYICCTSCHKSSYFSYHVSWKKKIHKRLADSLSPWWQQWRFHRIIAWLTVTVLSCEQTSSMPTALG